jgi:hypothetical protein
MSKQYPTEAGIRVRVPVASIRKSDYRHEPFGEAYRPFFERMCAVFGDVVPGTPADWEGDFRRDLNPEREMAIWSDVADRYEHFARLHSLDLGRKKDLLRLIMNCTAPTPKDVLRHVRLGSLARPLARKIVEQVYADRGGRGYPPAVVG